MADFSALKTAIQANICTNGNEEITGAILQDILLSMVSTMGDGAINALSEALQTEITNRQNAVSGEATTRAEADSQLSGRINAEAIARGEADTQLGNSITAITTRLNEGYVYTGIATPSTDPGTPAGKVFYIALQAGTYTNFSSLAVTQGINILKYNGTAWSQEQLIAIDDVPTAGSNNLVKSGGVFLYRDMLARNNEEIVQEVAYNNKYLKPDGVIANAAGYYITVPFELTKGTILWFSWYTNTVNNMTFLAKATSASDDGSNGYTPVIGASTKGHNTNGDSFPLEIMETGYYVLSWKTVYNIKPQIISSQVFERLLPSESYKDILQSLWFVNTPDIQIKSEQVQVALYGNSNGVVAGFTRAGYNYTAKNTGDYSGYYTYTLNEFEYLVMDISDGYIKKKAYNESLKDCIVILGYSRGCCIGVLAPIAYSSEFGSVKKVYYNRNNGYLDLNGVIVPSSSNAYFYSDPIPVKKGQVITMKVMTSGQTLLALTDSSASYYTPVVTVPSGGNYDGYKSYAISADGYVCFSADKDANLYASIDPAINELLIDTKNNSEKLDEVINNDVLVPQYWNEDDYIENRVKYINDLIFDSEQNYDGFVFVADTHNTVDAMKSPSLIEYILRKSYIESVVHGGDFTNGPLSGTASEQEAAIKLSLKLQTQFTEAITPYGSVCTLHGNHDIHLSNYGLSKYSVHNIIMNKLNNRNGVISRPKDTVANYFYYDNEFQSIRYVAFDTTDRTSGTSNQVSSVQMKWIIDNAIQTVPEGYNVVFLVHIPVVHNATSDDSYLPFANVRTLCTALKKKQDNVTIDGETYDFSTFNGNLLMVLGGHSHGDVETYVDGVLHVSSGSDAWINDAIRYSLFSDSKFVNKQVGTISEQLFDVVIITPEKDEISFIRIGASGYDRIFDLTKHEVSVGSTLQLSPSGTVSNWDYSDSDGLTYANTGHTPNIPIPAQTRISVSNSGLVIGLAAGEALVCATMSDGQTRRFYYINVI